MNSDDRLHMERAIAQAREQLKKFGHGTEAARPNPLVGCVVVTKSGRVEEGYRGEIVEGYHGENGPDDHAEFTVLEKKMADEVLVGATVYTTLEPCEDRTPPKRACADRLIERKVGRVVIGYMDPDDRGRGFHKLRGASISVELFPDDLMAQIEELNRTFIASRKKQKKELPNIGADARRKKDSIENADHQRRWRWRRAALGSSKDRLNSAFQGKAMISDVLRHDIRLRPVGPYKIVGFETERIKDEIEEIRLTKGQPGEKSNQYHAILSSTLIHEDEDNALDYYEADYATLRVAEKYQRKVAALYAGALVSCSEVQHIYLHRRSAHVAYYPNQLHTMSGNFIPRGVLETDDGLKDTARREIFEEMNASINVDAGRYPAIVIHEMESDRRICSYLGVDIPKSEAKKIRGSGEGEVIRVPFRNLGNILERPDWVQSGLANVLAWLALGAITIGSGPGFDRNVAYEHLERWLARHLRS